MPRLISFVLLLVASLQGPAKHPVVCAKGVHTYYSWKDVPTPFDSLKLPPGPKLMVNSPEEAQAAEQEMLKRAGATGATILMTTL